MKSQECAATKKCTKCGVVNPAYQFSPSRRKNNVYLASRCKSCCAAISKAAYHESTETWKERNRKWKAGNKGHISAYQKEWRDNNRDHISRYNKEAYQADVGSRRERALATRNKDPENARKKRKEWGEKNPIKQKAMRAANSVKYKTSLKQAKPGWADADKIQSFYAEASRRTEETGIPHHVDHIVPIRGKNVSGLHCEANLQVLTADENQEKSNTFG